MVQLSEHATFQVYQTYHTPVHISSVTQTYDHFSAGRATPQPQAQLLTGYMQAMIDALQADLNHQGDCWLLRAIVNHDLPAIHLLDHSAIAYVYSTIFTPEETPRLDARSIPYTSGYSRSAGGMLYADRRAKGCVIDLRTSDTLHLICHALLIYADRKALSNEVQRLTDEKNALSSRITQLSDRILGLEHELAAARSTQEC